MGFKIHFSLIKLIFKVKRYIQSYLQSSCFFNKFWFLASSWVYMDGHLLSLHIMSYKKYSCFVDIFHSKYFFVFGIIWRHENVKIWQHPPKVTACRVFFVCLKIRPDISTIKKWFWETSVKKMAWQQDLIQVIVLTHYRYFNESLIQLNQSYEY